MATGADASVNEQQRASLVKSKALELGFDSCGITDLSPTPHAQQLTDWLYRGLAGTMGYMHRQAAKRLEPKDIVPGATRAIVLTRNYYNSDPPTTLTSNPPVAAWSTGRSTVKSHRTTKIAASTPMNSIARLILRDPLSTTAWDWERPPWS